MPILHDGGKGGWEELWHSAELRYKKRIKSSTSEAKQSNLSSQIKIIGGEPAFAVGDIVRIPGSSLRLHELEARVLGIFINSSTNTWVYRCKVFVGNSIINPVFFRNDLLPICGKKFGIFQEMEDNWRIKDRSKWSFDPTMFGFTMQQSSGKGGLLGKDWKAWRWIGNKVNDFQSADHDTTVTFTVERISRKNYIINKETSVITWDDEKFDKKAYNKVIENEYDAFVFFDDIGIFDGKNREFN